MRERDRRNDEEQQGHPWEARQVIPCATMMVADLPRYGGIAEANPKQAEADKKVPLHLVPMAFSVYAAIALGEGAAKYGAWNFRETKVEAMTYVGALKRHLDDWVEGINIDPDSETGKPSLAGAAASLAILIDAIEGDFLIDNRPPPGGGPAAMKRFTKS